MQAGDPARGGWSSCPFEAVALYNKSEERDLIHSKIRRSKGSLFFPFWGRSRIPWAWFAVVILHAVPVHQEAWSMSGQAARGAVSCCIFSAKHTGEEHTQTLLRA